jgi:hypothetical protein
MAIWWKDGAAIRWEFRIPADGIDGPNQYLSVAYVTHRNGRPVSAYARELRDMVRAAGSKAQRKRKELI